jgi:hypothetical protein
MTRLNNGKPIGLNKTSFINTNTSPSASPTTSPSTVSSSSPSQQQQTSSRLHYQPTSVPSTVVKTNTNIYYNLKVDNFASKAVHYCLKCNNYNCKAIHKSLCKNVDATSSTVLPVNSIAGAGVTIPGGGSRLSYTIQPTNANSKQTSPNINFIFERRYPLQIHRDPHHHHNNIDVNDSSLPPSASLPQRVLISRTQSPFNSQSHDNDGSLLKSTIADIANFALDFDKRFKQLGHDNDLFTDSIFNEPFKRTFTFDKVRTLIVHTNRPMHAPYMSCECRACCCPISFSGSLKKQSINKFSRFFRVDLWNFFNSVLCVLCVSGETKTQSNTFHV